MKKTILTLMSIVASLMMSAQEADTTIVLIYGYGAVDTLTISKTSDTFLQIQEAEAAIEGITDQMAKNRAIVNYVQSHPDSDGGAYLLGQLMGVSNGRKCLAAISEKARNGLMKKLYDAYAGGMKEFEEMTAKTAEAIPIGKEAKDFTLEDINGQQLTLSSLRGKYVLIDFWGSWCGPCIAAFPHLKAFYERHRDKVEILGVAIHDKKDKWKAAVEKNELPWKLVIDEEGENSVAERYGIIASPTYVLLDPEGKALEWNLNELITIEEFFE